MGSAAIDSSTRMILRPRPCSAVGGTGSPGRAIRPARLPAAPRTGPVPLPSGVGSPSPLAALSTSMAHCPFLAFTCTSYSSPGPACWMTLAQASLSARAMSARVSGVTPKVCRQPSRTRRLTGTLAESRGRYSTILRRGSARDSAMSQVVVQFLLARASPAAGGLSTGCPSGTVMPVTPRRGGCYLMPSRKVRTRWVSCVAAGSS